MSSVAPPATSTRPLGSKVAVAPEARVCTMGATLDHVFVAALYAACTGPGFPRRSRRRAPAHLRPAGRRPVPCRASPGALSASRCWPRRRTRRHGTCRSIRRGAGPHRRTCRRCMHHCRCRRCRRRTRCRRSARSSRTGPLRRRTCSRGRRRARRKRRGWNPTHTPAAHASICVHASPSSQAVPSVCAVVTHLPVAGAGAGLAGVGRDADDGVRIRRTRRRCRRQSACTRRRRRTSCRPSQAGRRTCIDAGSHAPMI